MCDWKRARIGMAPLLAIAAAAAGCTTTERTEIVLGLATDLQAPDPLATVDLEIRRLPDDLVVGSANLPISGRVGVDYEIPMAYFISAKKNGSDGSENPFRVILSARDGRGARLIVRTAVMNLLPERRLFVRLGMVSACVGRFDCATGDTCIEGRCVSEQIDSTRLPAYTEDLEKEVSCAGATAYVNTGTTQPLPVMGTSCPSGQVCEEGACLLAPAAGAGSDGSPG